MIIRETAYARAGLMGNPSDIFHGKTMALLFDRFQTDIVLYETPALCVMPNERDRTVFDSVSGLVDYRRRCGYYGGIRLIEATIVTFTEYCRSRGIELHGRNFTIEYSSSIPFSVGLGGSSAIIKAVLSALMRFYGLDESHIPKALQPKVILEAETEELDIAAGPQDRVVMVYGGLVSMDFSAEAYARNGGAHGNYENLDPSLLPPLFIAFREALSKSSGKVHNVMRYRADVEHDQEVLEVMRRKAGLVDQAKALLLRGRGPEIGPLMSEDFDLRKTAYTISRENLEMVEIARSHGAHAKFTGSGGAVIGVYDDSDHFQRLETAYTGAGHTMFAVHPVEYPALPRA